jgi:hypothetical protein
MFRVTTPSMELAMPKTTVSINLRLPVEVHRALVARAAQDHRSLNGEIIWLLQQALKADSLDTSDQDKDESEI